MDENENGRNKKALLSSDTRRIKGIPASRVHNTDYLQSLGELYKCSICYNVIINPTDCEKCGHSYCLECITNNKCPYNCENVKVKPSSMGIKILLNQIVFKCANEGCNDLLSYNSVLHHDQECEYKGIKCPNNSCSKILPRKLLEKHIKEECRYSYANCKFCGNDFYRLDIAEHEESCEVVNNSLSNGSSSILPNKSLKSISNSKFLEALNINIAKLVKDNEQKYKTLEEENNKIKNELSLNVQNIFDKIKSELLNHNSNNNISGVSVNNISDMETTGASFNNVSTNYTNNLPTPSPGKFKINSDSDNFSLVESNLIKNNIVEVLQNNFNEIFVDKVKEILDNNTESIKDSIHDMESKISDNCKILLRNSADHITSKDNTQDNTQDSNPNYIERIIGAIKEMVKTSEQKICKQVKDIFDKTNTNTNTNNRNSIPNNFEEAEKDNRHDNNFKNNETIMQKLSSLDKMISELISKSEREETISSGLDANKLTSTFIKNVIEIVEDNNETFAENLEKELSKLNNSVKQSIDKLSEDLEGVKEEVTLINTKTKELKSMISEEFSDLVDNLEKNNNYIGNQCKIQPSEEDNSSSQNSQRNPNTQIAQVLNDKIARLEDKFTSLTNNISSFTNSKNTEELIETKFKKLESSIMSNFDHRLKEMYNLKWCNECEKVDYFYGFIKCDICNKENCKHCVLLCKTCKHLFCKQCVQCTKCGNLSCLNCRTACDFCSGEKFCSSCMTDCPLCKKPTCKDCAKQCISCKHVSCNDCSKFCRICDKSSCRKCETAKNFKTCYACQQMSCIECTIICSLCDFEICKNCFTPCKRCKKLVCKKCELDCALCEDAYCGNCAKEFNQNKCSICKKLYCTLCVKNFRKCKVCKESTCKDCHANCKKCKNFFCNNCNLNCDNCNDYVCASCIYKCSCDMVIFCEKCLLDINPIGPHDCVLWMNELADFTGVKSRSKLPLPKDFEAKVFLDRFESENLLIGVTDNNCFDEDTVSFVDNVWCLKAKTGQKYSSKKSLEPYCDKACREKDFIIIAVKNDSLYFRVNFDENPPAYVLPSNKKYYLYIENDNNGLHNVRVKFIYIRQI